MGREDRRGRPGREDRASTGGQVASAGAVRFDDHGNSTGVEVTLSYDRPAGVFGDAVAKLFADPQAKVEKALGAFKTTIESGTRAGVQP